ncbi:phospho-sugar mutase [Mycobacterium paraterrae]|uniref:Phospho-sugar mutase n=1 Tax=Mycobacterium paraterrae TaxID=577492 RepID=A0ABY3VSD3_9MYCO|nr:phospho-sugar mutase [Mycobacterium paraterrae]UMB72418.1 phospho-sugar mutase [Mycobacterium paraterrae]
MDPADWIAHDPDPVTATELAHCSEDELAQRFSRPLSFGTAGLRGPVRGGPDAMNLAVVLRATWALARVLDDRGLAGSTVIVGRDARHGSAAFATAAAEVLAAEGFLVTLLAQPLPTPVLAFAVRHVGAAAGIQITASHNPPADNGYKVYLEGGIQIVSPTDREIERIIAAAPFADEINRVPVEPSGSALVEQYITRAAAVRRSNSVPIRVALTALHGVGGAVAVETLRRAGFVDVHTVTSQYDPDPDFPTVVFPNPEEPGTTDELLALAVDVDADVAVALDPDADRCAVGVPTPTGWRMLSGDETGWLLGDYILSHAQTANAVVASTVVSSRMLAAIAAHWGARHVETLTGFKWLARADADLPGSGLVYAYEEAIGHCVDPEAVRDKDGISAAVLVCELVATLKQAQRSPLDALDDLARRFGVHSGAAVSRPVSDAAGVAALLRRLRASPPDRLGEFSCTTADLMPRTDALIFTGGDAGASARVVVRPSGTEPKVKFYIEATSGDRARADALRDRLVDDVRDW